MHPARSFLLTLLIACFRQTALCIELPEHNPSPLARLDGCGGSLAIFSGAGTRLLTADENNARVWDCRTFQPITKPIRHPRSVEAAALSADGKRVATASGTEVVLWDVDADQRHLAIPHADRVLDVCFSPDCRRVATACLDKSARIWDAATGKLLLELKHGGPVRSVVFSPDGTIILTGTVELREKSNNYKSDPGEVFAWDSLKGQKLWQSSDNFCKCIGRPVFSPDGKLTSFPSYMIEICDAATGKRRAMTRSFGADNPAIHFSATGHRILIASDRWWANEDEDLASVFEIKHGKPARPDEDPDDLVKIRGLALNREVRAAAMSADGRAIAVFLRRDDGPSGVWDVDTGKQMIDLPDEFPMNRVVAFSPDGSQLAMGIVKDNARYTLLFRVPPPLREPAAKSEYLADLRQALKQQWPENRAVHIVCHGHSVPAGYFKTPIVRAFDAYPMLLHKNLCDRFPTAVINVTVTAIGGENSEKGAERFERDVLSLHPDVVTIDYALNDRAIGLAPARAAWVSMIEKARDADVKVILMTPTPDMAAKLDDPTDPLNHHADQIRDLAAQYHVGLVDSLARFKKYFKDGGFIHEVMSQGNHPNRKGHEMVAEELGHWFER